MDIPYQGFNFWVEGGVKRPPSQPIIIAPPMNSGDIILITLIELLNIFLSISITNILFAASHHPKETLPLDCS